MKSILDLAPIAAAVVLGTLAFALLALSQERHWRAVRQDVDPVPPVWPRALAAVSLAASLAAALWSEGGSVAFGLLLWAVLLSVDALGVVAALAFRPRWLRPLAAGLGAVAGSTAGRHAPSGARSRP